MLCANNMHAYGKDHGVYLGPTSRPHLGIVLTTGLPNGQGQRSIQIDGLRVPVNGSKLQAISSDLHRGASGVQGWISYRGVSTILAQCLAMQSVGG